VATSCPLGGRNALGASSRIETFLIREETLGRGLRKVLEPPARWMGGRSLAPRLPPVDRAGGTHFSKISKTALFFKFNFLSFSKKLVNSTSYYTMEPGAGSNI
jgi:hypothetical protein